MEYLPTGMNDFVALYLGSPVPIYIMVASAAYCLGCFNGDVLKAVLAVLIGSGLFGLCLENAVLGKYWAGLFCLLGHMFPCMFGFKGGKGILSGGTIAIMIDWRVALVVWGGFLVLAALTRWVSLGSCWAGASFPFATWFVYHDTVLLALSILIGGLILWKHRANMGRMLKGEESKLSFHKKKEGV